MAKNRLDVAVQVALLLRQRLFLETGQRLDLLGDEAGDGVFLGRFGRFPYPQRLRRAESVHYVFEPLGLSGVVKA